MSYERQTASKASADELAERDARRQQDTERGRRAAKIAERQEHLDELDDLLDDIDTLLEETSIQVNYVQRGGE